MEADSVLLPSEEIGPPLDAFIDKSGHEYEGELYTILIVRVMLEAKTGEEGPYDLKAIFDFSVDDPIFDHGVWRTNKPTDMTTPATPYALTEPPERRPTIHVYVEPGYDFMWIEHHEPKYDDAMKLISNYPQNTLGSYIQSPDAFRELEAILSGTSPDNQDAQIRWQEQWEHWKNIDAFTESTKSISADRIIDKEESKRICFALDQWTGQMTDAIAYVQDYREVDPQTVEKNPGLVNLEHEANRALELLNQIECE